MPCLRSPLGRMRLAWRKFCQSADRSDLCRSQSSCHLTPANLSTRSTTDLATASLGNALTLSAQLPLTWKRMIQKTEPRARLPDNGCPRLRVSPIYVRI